MEIVTSEYAIGYESGYEIGYKIGYAKGAHEEKIRAAKNFFAYGYSLEDVRKMYPDLSIDLLDYLKSESDGQKSE